VKRLLFVLFFTAALAGPASAEKRVALVVGNSAYRSAARLDNPDNDAAMMARTLTELGFVLVGVDARTDLDSARWTTRCRRSARSARRRRRDVLLRRSRRAGARSELPVCTENLIRV